MKAREDYEEIDVESPIEPKQKANVVCGGWCQDNSSLGFGRVLTLVLKINGYWFMAEPMERIRSLAAWRISGSDFIRRRH